MRVTFLGSAETVTGSCFLIDLENKKKVLVDCGMFQAGKEIKEKNYGNFPFNPGEIEALLLTHSHIDHSGLIPKLVKHGFKGKIFCTKPTLDLCSIMLPDSGYIQEMEVERKNRKNLRANKKLLEPIYTVEDAENSLKFFKGVDYDVRLTVIEGMEVVFHDAGHIFGSAMLEIFCDGQKTIFSGDIGNFDQPIIKDPTCLTGADYIVMESTYGNRFHLETEDKIVSLKRVINKTLQRGGNVVIPAFAVERTQDLIYHLRKLIENKEIVDTKVYIDSPLAIKATKIFNMHPEYYDEETLNIFYKNSKNGEDVLNFPGLEFTLSVEESKRINTDVKSAIIISASGMCDAGRIKHHLKHNLWREESTVLIVGYQAEGTLGRRILDGAKTVKIHGEEVAVNATIERIEGFSAHADQKGLLNWVGCFSDKPKKIFLVHGEDESRRVLAEKINEMFDIETVIPLMNESYEFAPQAEELQIAVEEGTKDIVASISELLRELSRLDESKLPLEELKKVHSELERIKKIV